MQAAEVLSGPAAGQARGGRVEPVVWTCAMAVLVGVTIAGGGTGSRRGLDVAAGVVSLVLVPLLRRWPVPAAVALSLLAAVSPAATPPATLAVLLVARWQPLTTAAAVAATGIAAHLVRGAWLPVAGLPYLWWSVLVVVAYAALVGWGTLLRANRALIASLRERAERAEADQARRESQARAAERSRIAREMHDVLAHRLSLLATYAGALAYRPDAPPEQLAGAAEVIRDCAHRALEELREVIGVLRDDAQPDLAAASRPLPGLADLPGLVTESRAAGMRIETAGQAWQADGLPDTAGRTVYRVVQEGLTNARKHAPGRLVTVTLDGGRGSGLTVSVVNGSDRDQAGRHGAVPGSGSGLIGLAERLELSGGRLEVRDCGGEFRLRAWLPWPDDDGGPR